MPFIKGQISKYLNIKEGGETSQIVFRSILNLCYVLVEYSYFPFNKKNIFKYSEVEGLKNLDKALQGDKPVFILTGHFANGEMALFRTCLEGYKLNLIAKRVGHPFLDSVLFEIRELSGLKHIPPKKGSIDILKAAKAKEPVVFVHDQFMHPPRGLETTFLGEKTYTNPALAYFAQKAEAVVVPARAKRRGQKNIICFYEEIPFEKVSSKEEENVLHMTQKYNTVLEDWLKKDPADWMWVHRRWKKVKFKK